MLDASRPLSSDYHVEALLDGVLNPNWQEGTCYNSHNDYKAFTPFVKIGLPKTIKVDTVRILTRTFSGYDDYAMGKIP